MQTQAPTLRRMLPALLFSLVCVVLMIVTYVDFGGSTPLQAKRYRVSLHAPDAGNLVRGSDVQIAGVKIGSVTGVTRDGNGARVQLQIKPEFAPIRTQASAIVRTKTLLGEAYVELTAGPANAPAVADGGALAPRQVRPNVSLDQFLETFDPEQRARLRGLFAGMAKSLTGRAANLNAAAGSAAPYFGSLDTILTTLDGERPQVRRLLARSGDVLDVLGRRAGEVQAAVSAGRDVFAATAARDAALRATIRELPGFVGRLRTTSQILATAGPDLNGAVAAIRPVARLVKPTLDAVIAHAPPVLELLRALPGTIAAGRQGLPALTATLRAVPTAFDELYPAARQLIPVMQLFGEYRQQALITPLGNGASAFNGKIVGPKSKILTRPGASLFVSNETVGGWVKKLPTNRANPYPTPTSLSAIATKGHFLTYDCRNTGNINYLPPLGTGAPPCDTQGPWTYRGVNAYYPRLQPSPP